jgi:hypothetical protein
LILEGIRWRLNSVNAWYHSVQNFFLVRCLVKVKITVYKTASLLAVLYSCETWSLILREEHRLRVFKDRELRRILESGRDEVTGGWRKMHNEELHNVYSSLSVSIIRIEKSRSVGV